MTTRENQQPVRPPVRDAIYNVIDGERDYQDAGEGNSKNERSGPMSIAETILHIETCLHKAREAIYKPGGAPEALRHLRKVAALSVYTFENYGVPPREFHVPATSGITGTLEIHDPGDKL